MQALSINPRSHYIVLHDGRQFAITEQQYEWIKFDKKWSKVSDMFELRDADTGKMIFDWEFRSIKEFREIPKNTTTRNYICDFWKRHDMHENCECKSKYSTYPWVFREKAYEMFWTKNEVKEELPNGRIRTRNNYNMMYMQDLTWIEFNKVLDNCKKFA